MTAYIVIERMNTVDRCLPFPSRETALAVIDNPYIDHLCSDDVIDVSISDRPSQHVLMPSPWLALCDHPSIDVGEVAYTPAMRLMNLDNGMYAVVMPETPEGITWTLYSPDGDYETDGIPEDDYDHVGYVLWSHLFPRD